MINVWSYLLGSEIGISINLCIPFWVIIFQNHPSSTPTHFSKGVLPPGVKHYQGKGFDIWTGLLKGGKVTEFCNKVPKFVLWPCCIVLYCRQGPRSPGMGMGLLLRGDPSSVIWYLKPENIKLAAMGCHSPPWVKLLMGALLWKNYRININILFSPSLLFWKIYNLYKSFNI